ncbi:MAG: hypothetical protein ACPL3P_07870 [Anaerolineales bacterium]
MKQFSKIIFLIFLIFLIIPQNMGIAQTYLFQVVQENVDAYWNDDGTLTVAYQFYFKNSPKADAIDFVDIGSPTADYDIGKVSASINGNPITQIEKSPYVKNGIAVGLGNYAIPPGGEGTLEVIIYNIKNVLYVDSQDSNYASAVFTPTWFGSEYVQGSTNLTVTYHLPSGVQPQEPKWHAAPNGFSAQPTTGFDQNGHITYTWNNPNASTSAQYKFGASFPKTYVPDTAIVAQSINVDALVNVILTLICILIPIFGVVIVVSAFIRGYRRKTQYMPPKIALEGHGIKRGLTAVEAAILMEQPLDKVLTMILFSLIKKGAVKVTSKDPFEIETINPLPQGLRPYEEDFIKAFEKKAKSERQEALQEVVIGIVRSVQEKMRGFSRKETVNYYKSIVDTAWKQVEAANTPEVKSQKFDENLEWTMLDKDYDDHTRNVFGQGPVFVPIWWSRYDPTFSPAHTTPSVPTAAPSTAPTQISLPRLPGSDFAASMVKGVQNFSASVIGNVESFTGKVTSKTNPEPIPTSSRSSSHSSGGCACACACACAGCACACAGGGR